MAPTPTAAPKPANGADETVRKQLIIAALCHMNSIRRSGRPLRPTRAGPKLVVVDPTRGQDQIREDVARHYGTARSRGRPRVICSEMRMARWEAVSSKEPMHRVPSSTEDGLSSMMAQLQTSAPGSGDHGIATVSTATSPAPDQSGFEEVCDDME